jgi:cellobiose phosphorylase
VTTLQAGQFTPAPWVNVLANPNFGTVVSESGAGYTWLENAHEFRLTPWHNDAVQDPSSEAIYIRDEQTGQFWSPTPAPAPNGVCRHGFGYSVFVRQMGINSEPDGRRWTRPVKLVVVKVRNRSARTRRLSVTGYWELVTSNGGTQT